MLAERRLTKQSQRSTAITWRDGALQEDTEQEFEIPVLMGLLSVCMKIRLMVFLGKVKS